MNLNELKNLVDQRLLLNNNEFIANSIGKSEKNFSKKILLGIRLINKCLII